MSIEKKSVEIFLYDLIAIVDKGFTETIEEVEKQIKSERIAQYILEKYKNAIELNINSPTNVTITEDRVKIINSEFWNGISCVKNSEAFRINESNNGLLFIIAIGISLIANREA